MPGRKAVVELGKRYGMLVIIERADSDKYRHPRVKCQCDCGKQKVVLLSKVRSKDPKQWAHSCGCQKAENYLKYMRARAGEVSRTKRARIFADRCAGKGAADIGRRFDIQKPLVDAVVRLRQEELKTHSYFEAVQNAVLARTPYATIASLCRIQTHEVAWLAKGIKSEYKLELKQFKTMYKEQEEMAKTHTHLASLCNNNVDSVKEDMQTEQRKHFRSSEWTLSKHRSNPEGASRANLQFAYSFIVPMAVLGSNADRKKLLRWFRWTIAQTIVHRGDMKRAYARKASSLGESVLPD